MSKPPNPPNDPMPRRIEPCSPVLEKKPPEGAQWVHEIKWDGYRIHVHVEPGAIRILTSGGHDWARRFPSISEAVKQLGARTLILDGEAVVLDKQGRSDFSLLQQALGGKGGTRNAGAAQLVAFDLLYLDGQDLRRRPLAERRRMLEALVQDKNGAIFLSEWLGTDGGTLFRIACEHGLEGIVSKKLDAPYHSGDKPRVWVKVKCEQRGNFIIVGFERSTALPSHISRLMLAARKEGGLVYVGSVGTGWSDKESLALRELLEMVETGEKPVAVSRKGAVFVEPRFSAAITFRAWTEDKKLRHPSWKGIAAVEDCPEVYEIAAES
ncbi:MULTISPECIES: non-homologous end-joining DNA ligase [unclassified Ensifer]|uniref:non-homologous end-joining DNA ligase n=1 Tax=unclassified Ensifer TaxID=2633371 RepID=UPI0009F66DF3|nr:MULTISPECIES: non-homologous end-joining DNA ligase [unclassified Ensifer]